MASDDQTLSRLEAEMRACDQELDECLQRHTGLASFGEYVGKVGADNLRMQLEHPPLPPGFVDAAELRMMLLSRKADTPEARLLFDVRKKLKTVEQVPVLADAGNKCMLPGLARDKQQLLGEQERLEQTIRLQTQQRQNRLWGLLVPNGEPVTVMDGVGFRSEFSELLRRKLDLLCEHRLAVAERILRMRSQTIARSLEFVERINAAADRFQARIVQCNGLNVFGNRMGLVSNMILPLRHEYAWHAHFPSLAENIPESLPSNGDPTQWLLDLSLAIERDRAAATKG